MRMAEEVRPALLGAAGGAIVLGLVGFTLGGWMTGGSAAALAKESSTQAVIVAYGDLCVHQFNSQPDMAAKLTELKTLSEYQQAMFLEAGGWATMPGADKPLTGVGRACAGKLAIT